MKGDLVMFYKINFEFILKLDIKWLNSITKYLFIFDISLILILIVFTNRFIR